MKKNSKILGLILIALSVILCKDTNAYTVYYPDVVPGQEPEVRRYMTQLDDGGTYMTYCIDPGRSFGAGKSHQITTYETLKVLDLSKMSPGTAEYKFTIAASYIYQQMLNSGYAGTSDTGRIVGQTAFRIARMELWDGGRKNGSLKNAYEAYQGYGSGLKKNNEVNVGIQYARDGIDLAIKYGNTSYEELIKNSEFNERIWTPSFEANENNRKYSEDGKTMYIEFSVHPSESKSSKMYKDALNVTCSNKSVSCSVTSTTIDESVSTPTVTVNLSVDISNWDQQDLGIDVHVAYCDANAVAYQLALLYNPDAPYNQYMLVVLPGECPQGNSGNSRVPRSTTRVNPSQTCECEKDENGNWTNKYIVKYFKNGLKIDEKILDYGPSVPTELNCPSADICNKKDDGNSCECQYDSNNVWTGKYILNSFSIINGVKVPNAPQLLLPNDPLVKDNPKCPTPEQCDDGGNGNDDKNCACEYNEKNEWTGRFLIKFYENGVFKETKTVEQNSPEATANNCKPCDGGGDNKDPKHSCQTPEESGDGNYYGPESSPGKGDGKLLGNDEKAKQDYLKACTNICAPTVSIPGTCTDFDEEGDHLKASINDINKTSTSCNSNVNPVTTCVLGEKDSTGASYEATTDGNKGNKYCKVWCEESYDFNLPTARLGNSGEYFTLVMSIRGKRNCYTTSAEDPTKSIGLDKNGNNIFLSDLEIARKKVIDKYNEYAKWAAAAGKDASKESISNSGKTCSSDDDSDDDSSSGGPGGSDGSSGGNSSSSGGPGTVSNKTNSKKNINAIFLNEDGCTECTAGKSSTTYYKKEWEWTKYNYDGTTSKQNETYESGSCGDCSCTPGDDPDSLEKKCDEKSEEEKENCTDVSHSKNRDQAKAELEKAIKEFYQVITTYNSCSGNLKTTSPLDLGSKEYTSNGWFNDMQFDPKVTFDYNENYLEKVSGNFTGKGNKETKTESKYCTGDIDNSYNCKNGSSASADSNDVPSSITESKNFLLCDTTGCGIKTISYSSAKWVKKSVTISEDFGPNRQFSTLTPYGTIKIGEDGSKEFYTPLPEDALPVRLITKTGAYPFKFTFEQIGQANNDKGSLGRLIGNSKSVLTAFNNLKKEDKCSGTDNVAADNVTNDVTGGYVCHYIANCPDCTGSCTPEEKCELCLPGDPDCTDPCTDNCQAFCKNCIFDGNKSTYSFKPVSLNNLFPNGIDGKNQGWNWNNDYKGQITKSEIESDGESIYEQPQFSVDLTIKNLKNIREYNDNAGSFVNAKLPDNMPNGSSWEGENSIYCDQVTIAGKVYNVRCKSAFLDYMDEHKGVYGTINERITRNSDGFELFTDDSVQNITKCGRNDNYKCLSQVGIGPSWRVKKLGGRS